MAVASVGVMKNNESVGESVNRRINGGVAASMAAENVSGESVMSA
jgi:hypothetical protein